MLCRHLQGLSPSLSPYKDSTFNWFKLGGVWLILVRFTLRARIQNLDSLQARLTNVAAAYTAMLP